MYARTALRSMLVLILVGACGGSRPPTYQLTQSEAAIRGAEEVGATKVPQAALHLKMARDNLSAGQNMMTNQDQHGEAALLLRRAEADAEVAIALSKEAQAKAEAEAAREKIQRLKKEME